MTAARRTRVIGRRGQPVRTEGVRLRERDCPLSLWGSFHTSRSIPPDADAPDEQRHPARPVFQAPQDGIQLGTLAFGVVGLRSPQAEGGERPAQGIARASAIVRDRPSVLRCGKRHDNGNDHVKLPHLDRSDGQSDTADL